MTQTIQKTKDIVFNSLNSSCPLSRKIFTEKLPEFPTTKSSTPSYYKRRNKNALINLKSSFTKNKQDEKFSDTADSAHGPSSGNESNIPKNFLEKKRKRKQKKVYSTLKNKKKVPVKSTNKNKNMLSKSNNIKENVKNIKEKCFDLDENKNLNEKSSKKEQIKKTQTHKNPPKEKQKTIKELIAQNELNIIEQVNKEYSDIEYQKDLKKFSSDEKSEFMKKNFPIMYRKDKYYIYTILLRRRRKETKHFLYPEDLLKIRQHNNELQYQNLYNDIEIFDENKKKNEMIIESKGLENLKNDVLKKSAKEDIYKKVYKTIPRKVWSHAEKNDDLDIEKFFDDCVQIWPFDECNFIKEIALEYLMKKKYDAKSCLGGLNDFVEFTKKRAVELDFAIQSDNVKTVKKYNLRKTIH